MPSSIHTGFSFTFSNHLHDILYESETAPRLPGIPITRDLPFSRESVHPTPINDGTARRPGVDRRPAGGFPVAREGGDVFREQRVLLVSGAEAAVARTTPDKDVSATRANACSRRGEGGCGGEGTRRIAHTFESTARLFCGPAEIWTTFRSFRIFTRANRKGRTPDFCMSETRKTYPACLQSRTQSVHS